jgi:Predicted periplasmic or secreted lipoprotein
VNVEAYDGLVVLNGTVADIQARAATEGSIVRLPGVHALVQQLETKCAPGVGHGPAEIALNAIRALRSAPLPEDSNVTAVVDHGWLRLEGTVSSAKAREEIHRRLENIVGARGFVDRIVIAQRHRGAGSRDTFAKDPDRIRATLSAEG